MATQIGPKIGIDGEREYRQQIKQIIDQTKNLDVAMQKTASEWNKSTSAMTKNKAIAQNLVQSISLQKDKLQVMNQMLEEATQKYGEGSSAAMAWKRAVDQATISINNMQNELNEFHGAEGFTDFQTKLADMGTSIQNFGQNMTSLGQRLTASLTLPIAAAGTAAVKLGSDLEESANKVDVVFGNMSQSVKDFASESLDAYAISEGKALEMAGDYGAMATSIGLSEKEAANLSTSMVALAGDMASFHNKSIDIAQNSLKGVFTGETEALKQFGVAMTQANLEDFAAKQGKVYSSMSQAEKAMLRYQYVMESQSAAIGDAGRTMDGFAGSTRKLQGALQEAGAALGQALIPIVTPMVNALTKMLQMFASLPAPIQKFIAVLLLIVAAVGPVILILGTLVSAIGALITNIPLIIGALAGLVPALGAVAAAAGPVVIAILAIVAGIALGYAVAKNWDTICASLSNTMSELASSVSNAYNSLMSMNDSLKTSVHTAVSDIALAFSQLPSKIVKALKDAADKVKQEFANMIKNAKKSGKDFVEGFVDGIKEKISKVVEACEKVANTVKDYLGFSCPDKGPLSEYETWMPDFMSGLAKGIYSSMSVVKNAVDDVAKTMSVPLSSNASMNMALAGSTDSGIVLPGGGTTWNIYVDHISELQDLIRIKNQAQQRNRMGANEQYKL